MREEKNIIKREGKKEMQKEKYNWKPVKVLAVIFMAGLLFVLLPKLGTEVKAAMEIGFDTTEWEGELTLTSGNVTINDTVRLDNDVILNVATGSALTVNGSVLGNGHLLTVTGQGTVTINGQDGYYGIDGNVTLNGGTMNVTGGNGGDGISGNTTINGGTMTVTGGAGGIGISGPLTLNGGSLTVNGGNDRDTIHCLASELIFNGGELTLLGLQSDWANYAHGGMVKCWYAIAIDNHMTIAIVGPVEYIYDGSIDFKRSAIFETATQVTFTLLPTYSFTITAGTGMYSEDHLSQINPVGDAMSNVYFDSNEGYYFPESYSVASVNGISVTRISARQIRISGTPTADTAITLPNATAQTPQPAPQAVFNAAGADKVNISNLVNGARYAVTGAATATFTASGTAFVLEGVSAGTLCLVRKGNGENLSDSTAQQVTIGKKTTPVLIAVQPSVIGEKGNIPTNTDHEYSTDGSVWNPCTGELADLEPNTYYIRVKASNMDLASGAQTIVITSFQPTAEATPSVTFTATGEDSGRITGLTPGAAYHILGAGLSGTDITADSDGAYAISSGMEAGTLKVMKKGNNTTTVTSAALDISVLRSAAPNSITATACSVESDDNGILSGITAGMEYKKSGDPDWTTGTGEDITGLTDGTYYVRYKAVNTSLASEIKTIEIGAYAPPAPAVVTPSYTSEPVTENVKEAPKSSTFTRRNKDGSVTTITIIWNEDGTTTVITETVWSDGRVERTEETRDAKGNGTLKIEKKDGKGNLLSSTDGTIKVNKKGTETIKSTTKNADGSVSEKTQKTYKRDPNADNIKKVTVTEKKTDAEGNTETIKTTALVGVLGDATISEKSTYNGAGAEGKTAVTVKEERQYALSVNGRLKLTSLTTDREKLTIPESVELDGMTRVVKAIGKNAMKGNKTVKEVVLGENITTICAGAFKNCKNLELIELTGSVKKIYKNAFKGIAENAKFVITASEEDFNRIVELLKESGVSDTVTFERVEA